MRQREEIPASVELPATPPARRMEAVEKARQLMTPPAQEPPAGAQVKLTTRVPPDLIEWLKGEVKRYRAEHPRAPKVTIEELMRVAIEHLKDAKNLDALITKHRTT